MGAFVSCVLRYGGQVLRSVLLLLANKRKRQVGEGGRDTLRGSLDLLCSAGCVRYGVHNKSSGTTLETRGLPQRAVDNFRQPFCVPASPALNSALRCVTDPLGEASAWRCMSLCSAALSSAQQNIHPVRRKPIRFGGKKKTIQQNRQNGPPRTSRRKYLKPVAQIKWQHGRSCKSFIFFLYASRPAES
jgi:hypothetical protein